MNYKKHILQYCKDKHVTYAEFAKQCGVSVRSIYRWINGASIKEPATEIKVREILGITNEELFDSTVDEFLLFPEEKQIAKPVNIGEDYYNILRDLAFRSNTSIRYAAEMCIEFAAARYKG